MTDQNLLFYIVSICCVALLMLCISFALLYFKRAQKLRNLELFKAQTDVLSQEKERVLAEVSARCENLVVENAKLLEENTKIKSDIDNQKRFMEEKLAYLEKNKEELALKFRDISNEVIKAQNSRFGEEQKNAFNLMLKPFQEQMSEFKNKVESVHQDSLKNKSSFDEQFKTLLTLNQNLSKDAENLSAALKGNKKIQGNWGEFQLERILEISGLEEHINYEKQETFRNEENQMLRPDVIIRLPNERSVIIDSKVSLNDYVNYVNCEDEALRQVYLKKHIQCIRSHIDELSGKDYQKLIKNNALDYVVIFIPIESAYVEAVKADNTLYDYAYKKNIAITTPSSLLPILRTIENLWQIENQNKNVARIAELGGSLYDKLFNFTEDMQRIDKSIDAARKNYDQAIKKLSTGKGNALSLAAQLKQRGAKTGKTIELEYDEENEIKELTDINEVVNEEN